MTFNPSKRVSVKVSEIERARFWYEVRLYLKVLLIVGIPFALFMWALMQGFSW